MTDHELDEIALLARLHLEADERERMKTDLAHILEIFTALAGVDTTGVEPMCHAVPMDLPLRADEPAPSLPVADALRAAPQTAGDLFVVPSILPGES
jgi:aspartyl-tRNA(Asn)/glutamyl-tRNA(Gln) amidotransferase subunit C